MKPIRHAEIRICGLGFYELTINGQKVGDSEFAPSWSDYDKTVFFNTYDVTRLIQQDDNNIRVLLGNGFYNEQGGRYHKLRISFGPPTLLFLLYVTYEDSLCERLLSDEKCEWTLSPITFNSIYGGEDYDARLELSEEGEEAGWKPVVMMEGPKGLLRPQIAHPVKLMERYPVKQVLRKDTILVLDMGQNLAGFPEITVSGQRGQQLKLTPGETLDANGLVNQRQTGRPHYYTYTLRGEHQESWHPRFSYYSFRYLQVEGDVNVLKVWSHASSIMPPGAQAASSAPIRASTPPTNSSTVLYVQTGNLSGRTVRLVRSLDGSNKTGSTERHWCITTMPGV